MADVSPDERGLAQARRRALYEIGDADWADVIIHAYLNPDIDKVALWGEQRAFDLQDPDEREI